MEEWGEKKKTYLRKTIYRSADKSHLIALCKQQSQTEFCQYVDFAHILTDPSEYADYSLIP